MYVKWSDIHDLDCVSLKTKSRNISSCWQKDAYTNKAFMSFITIFMIIVMDGIPVAGQGIDSIHSNLQKVHTWPPSIPKDSALSFAYNYLAEGYSGQQDSLAQLYIDSLAYLLPVSTWPKTEGHLLRARGKYHDRRGEFQEALDAYSGAISFFESIHDQTELLAYTYILKAFVLNNNGMQDACYETLEKIRPLAERLPNKNYLAWIIDCYGDHHFYSAYGRQDFRKALGYYQDVEKLLPEVKSMMIKADNAHGLAGCYMRLGDEAAAIEYRNKALEIAEEHKLHSVIFAVYGDLADVYEEKGEFEKALAYRLLGLDYARKTGWIEMEARAHKTVAYTYKIAGDFEKALKHFEELKMIEDSLARFQVQARYQELEVKYELGKKDLHIEKLHARNLRMWLYILVGLVIGGILFLLYFRGTNKKLQQQNKALSTKNYEIQRALTEGQNIERKRMAIELHDNINAKIAAAKWILEAINTPDKSPEEQNVINRLVDSLADIYDDVRFISHNLVPKDIESKELSVLINQLVVNLNQNQKIKFSYTLKGKDPGLGNEMKIHVYAIVMELVSNIIRHSGCQQAAVSLEFTTDRLNIIVEDDGKGFDVEEVRTGTGLKNLESRINSVHGQLKVSSSLQKGVTVRISMPLHKSAIKTDQLK